MKHTISVQYYLSSYPNGLLTNLSTLITNCLQNEKRNLESGQSVEIEHVGLVPEVAENLQRLYEKLGWTVRFATDFSSSTWTWSENAQFPYEVYR